MSFQRGILIEYLRSTHDLNITDEDSFTDKNIVNINVYFRELSVFHTTESPKYTVSVMGYERCPDTVVYAVFQI